ncbi:IS481 family transposase [Inquilinus sp. Marseille-Q2685]|uniref:IS481 family transposase n=1 Tax=Inquilinus sp. Marseille-Q2685 TaxID=2866581 RepID=UPI001CE46464|nr:IS481 family transposase [Inquilinus sp. Marseille-Q2685]
MAWREVSVMEQRREFVRLAEQEGANRRELCRRFGISPDVGYKWLARWQAGDAELADRSRRPHVSPGRSTAELETAVLAVRDAHPAWGARKIVRRLAWDGIAPPAASTVHAILVRHGRIDPVAAEATQPYRRFEAAAPNRLWQMDFKGWEPLVRGGRCYPLTVLDDHSRFSPCLQACADQKSQTVQDRLTATFRRHGLPEAIFIDNGAPWGDASGERWTRLAVWFLKLGIRVLYSRPYHPQSRGKIERFHRTLAAEVFALEPFPDLAAAQRAFDRWRELYNWQRPHQALQQQVPGSRYRSSPRAMPSRLPEVEYDSLDLVRTVGTTKAYVSFRGRLWKVPQAFRGERVAIRPQTTDGRFGVFFASHLIATIDLTDP